MKNFFQTAIAAVCGSEENAEDFIHFVLYVLYYHSLKHFLNDKNNGWNEKNYFVWLRQENKKFFKNTYHLIKFCFRTVPVPP